MASLVEMFPKRISHLQSDEGIVAPEIQAVDAVNSWLGYIEARTRIIAARSAIGVNGNEIEKMFASGLYPKFGDALRIEDPRTIRLSAHGGVAPELNRLKTLSKDNNVVPIVEGIVARGVYYPFPSAYRGSLEETPFPLDSHRELIDYLRRTGLVDPLKAGIQLYVECITGGEHDIAILIVNLPDQGKDPIRAFTMIREPMNVLEFTPDMFPPIRPLKYGSSIRASIPQELKIIRDTFSEAERSFRNI